MDAKENGEQGITGYATECGCSHGLTKREHFAAMAKYLRIVPLLQAPAQRGEG